MKKQIKLGSAIMLLICFIFGLAIQLVYFPFETEYRDAMQRRPEVVAKLQEGVEQNTDFALTETCQGALEFESRLSKLPQLNFIKLKQIMFDSALQIAWNLTEWTDKLSDIGPDAFAEMTYEERLSIGTNCRINFANENEAKLYQMALKEKLDYLSALSMCFVIFTAVWAGICVMLSGEIICIILSVYKHRGKNK